MDEAAGVGVVVEVGVTDVGEAGRGARERDPPPREDRLLAFFGAWDCDRDWDCGWDWAGVFVVREDGVLGFVVDGVLALRPFGLADEPAAAERD